MLRAEVGEIVRLRNTLWTPIKEMLTRFSHKAQNIRYMQRRNKEALQERVEKNGTTARGRMGAFDDIENVTFLRMTYLYY